jgi:membrane dipeptidase
MNTRLPIVDSHLDLGENVTQIGRDLTRSVAEIRAAENRSSYQATVSLPELGRGGIAVAFATVTAGSKADEVPVTDMYTTVYHTPEEAEAQALEQIDLYERWEKEGRVRILKSVTDLEHHLGLWQTDRKPGLVLLMEGADPIVKPSDLPKWWQRGLRMIGLTWSDTRYGAGVGVGSTDFSSRGLTPEGKILLENMAEQGFIWDISHLAEQGVREGFEMGFLRVCATHCNPRALLPTNRHLSDDTIKELAQRQGVMGLVLYNGFLEPGWLDNKQTPVTLQHLERHAAYVANLVGWEHLGIGSDLDGGVGLEESPLEIDTVADLYKIADVIPDHAKEKVLSGNWLRFLRRTLPRGVVF